MRYYEIFEDAKMDLATARQAQKMVSAFTHWLHKATENGSLNDNPGIRTRRVEGSTLVYVSAEEIGLDGHPDLSFGLMKNNGKGVAGCLYKSIPNPEHARRYWATLMVDFDPLTKEDIIFSIGGSRWNDLEHEVIHYFDYVRGFKTAQALVARDNKAKKRNAQARGGPWDADIAKTNYFNDPLEFNAYYQAGVSEILTRITRAPPRKDRTHFLDNYDTFERTFRDCFHATWFGRLSYPNSRRFDKRLYGLFTMLSQNWPNIDEIKDRVAEAQAAYAKWAEKDKLNAA